MLTVRKRLNVYEYRFEIAKINNKRRWKSKSGFKTKSEAIKAGISAYNEYMNTGHSFEPTEMSYCDFLDYWIKEYCNINLKYHTIEAYNNIIKNHIKPTIGFYKLSQINPALLQEMINHIYVEKGFSKNFLKNIIKVIKGSFSYATDAVGFIKYNPALKVRLPKYDIQEKDPVHIITKEEIEIILNRMKNNRCAYYALLTAYYTGLRISEVFGLTWDDIDLVKKTISINKNIIEKNQIGSTKKKHLSGNSTTVWYFGTCKTKSSYRTINIGDTLVNALKNYKKEQEENEIEYGNTYMLHYIKEVVNKYNNKPEIKIVNAYAELEVPLQRVNLVFVKNNGVFQGTATMKYPFKIIHYELGIPCRFHDLRETHATKLIECGGDVKAIASRLGHSSIGTTYDIYVRVTNQMKNNTVDIFEKYASMK